ncbi:ABC transporter permease [Candidatus Hydrogenisulfobacillus filiaventi]|uniref:ABC transporter permease n=1 Tax=Candidatus Hydrogenisulfobacillus filiaventi TaxID=2707344 RepID=A0A6F8ZF55_9FIRM|nr:ABC transporter permease [Bacillota bacterium]CAB1128263.1 ABC transporter permease [Candidatus Hydrogenisulfobacillus filiaventi]
MATQQVPAPEAGPSAAGWRQALRQWWMALILLGLVGVFTLVAPGFFSLENLRSTTLFASDTLLLGIGETLVIITGGIDLSVGAILGLAGMTAGWAMQAVLTADARAGAAALLLGFAVALATGTAAGLVNGLVITRMGITPFIATLGMLGIATGFTFLITNGTDITILPAALNAVGNTALAGWLPVPFLVALGVALAAHYVLTRTRFGLYTYAIGSNPEGARVSGIDVPLHLLKVYTLSGLIAGLAGILVVARLMAASPLEGANDELNAIAAVVIGGASLFGGRGRVLGTLIGGLVISVLVTGLVIAGVQPYWQTVAIGATIILAVYIDQSQQRAGQDG